MDEKTPQGERLDEGRNRGDDDDPADQGVRNPAGDRDMPPNVDRALEEDLARQSDR